MQVKNEQSLHFYSYPQHGISVKNKKGEKLHLDLLSEQIRSTQMI